MHLKKVEVERWNFIVILTALVLFYSILTASISLILIRRKNVEVKCYGTEGYNLNLNYIRNTTETSFSGTF